MLGFSTKISQIRKILEATITWHSTHCPGRCDVGFCLWIKGINNVFWLGSCILKHCPSNFVTGAIVEWLFWMQAMILLLISRFILWKEIYTLYYEHGQKLMAEVMTSRSIELTANIKLNGDIQPNFFIKTYISAIRLS